MTLPQGDDSFRKQLMVRVCTWNVGESSPLACSTDMLNDWLFGRNKRQADVEPDIIAIGLQEVDMSFKALWFGCCGANTAAGVLWKSALADHLDDYELVSSDQLMGMELIVFIRKEISSQITCESDSACSGWFGLFANKGGMASRLTIFNHETSETSRICIINCHFAAKEDKVSKRNEDHDTLLREIKFTTAPHSILGHDHVFWAGDLNYRLQDIPDSKISSLTNYLSNSSQIRELLAEYDQLRLQMAAGRVFKNFLEPEISFPPSYKVLKHSIERKYDTKRVPSYCDRILHYTFIQNSKVGNDVENRSSSPLLDIEMSSACGSLTSPTSSSVCHPVPVFDSQPAESILNKESDDTSTQTDRSTEPIVCFEYSSTIDNAGSDHRAVSGLYRIPSITLVERFEEVC